VELVLALLEALGALDRSGLVRAQQRRAEAVAEQVVLGGAVEVREGEGVALAHRDRGRGVVQRDRVCLLLSGGCGGRGSEDPRQDYASCEKSAADAATAWQLHPRETRT
jgi:hypothetical protein